MLALRQRDWRNCGLCVCLYAVNGATLLLGTWRGENQKNQRQCASISINVALLILSFKRAIPAPNKLIDRGHCKRLRRKILIASYSLSHFTLTTTQLNLSFQKTLNYFKTIQTGFIFSQPPLNLFKPDKHVGSFLVRTSFQTNDQPGPKRSIKITDHFTCACANVIYCITCAFCRKL